MPSRITSTRFIGLAVCLWLLVFATGCDKRPKGRPEKIPMVVTGYCDCKKCTGWKRNWYFRPVYAYGAHKGKPKKVGITADGTRAREGVIAADPRYFPFGTVMRIPGYGYGVVHDTGSAIKRRHIDLFFDDHDDALEWGRQRLVVEVWRTKS